MRDDTCRLLVSELQEYPIPESALVSYNGMRSLIFRRDLELFAVLMAEHWMAYAAVWVADCFEKAKDLFRDFCFILFYSKYRRSNTVNVSVIHSSQSEHFQLKFVLYNENNHAAKFSVLSIQLQLIYIFFTTLTTGYGYT